MRKIRGRAGGVLKSSEADAVRSELRALANPAKARILSGFFKTGRGEYGEGDRFLGVVMPQLRKVVKAHWRAPEGEIVRLLRSEYHEERMAALLMLVEQYRRGDESRKKAIYELYLANTAWINNWDLVDLTAPYIIGAQLAGTDSTVRRGIRPSATQQTCPDPPPQQKSGEKCELRKLARSESLWERRIAMLATYHFIRQGDGRAALETAGLLLHDPHDLIHKAVGWMLREVGKRCSMEQECGFLDTHAAVMPRTMLRYAIERFPDSLKLKYLRMGKNRSQKSGVRSQKPKTNDIPSSDS